MNTFFPLAHRLNRSELQNTKRIWVVDDEPDACANLCDILEGSGFKVRSCTDPRQAIEQLEETEFDVALIDLRMPGMDGLELFRQIRVARPEAPAVLVTAYASPETAETAASEGIYEIVSKPVDVPNLLHVIDQACT